MAVADHRDEQRLVAGVMAGDRAAVSRFLELAAGDVWSTVAVLVGEGAAGEEAFLSVVAALKANRFARLARYDGRSRLSTFLTLATREVLAEQTARTFSDEPNRAWRRFERFFGADIRRRVRQRFPRADEARREDLFQDVCLKLVEDDYRRIRSYGGHGSFTGYVLATVDRLLIDLLRREAPRRRLPAEVARMSTLHQAVFMAGAWEGASLDGERMAGSLAGKVEPPPSARDVEAVLDQLAGVIAAARGATARPEEVSIDTDAGQKASLAVADPLTAESLLVDRQEQAVEDALVDRVQREAEALPGEDRLFLQIVFQATEPLPSREIARLMSLPVEDVYRLRQRTQRWLKQIAVDLQKNAAASV